MRIKKNAVPQFPNECISWMSREWDLTIESIAFLPLHVLGSRSQLLDISQSSHPLLWIKFHHLHTTRAMRRRLMLGSWHRQYHTLWHSNKHQCYSQLSGATGAPLGLGFVAAASVPLEASSSGVPCCMAAMTAMTENPRTARPADPAAVIDVVDSCIPLDHITTWPQTIPARFQLSNIIARTWWEVKGSVKLYVHSANKILRNVNRKS